MKLNPSKLVTVLCLIVLVGLAFMAPRSPFIRLAIAAGTPDAYEQQILYVEIYQWDNVSSEFDLVGNVTAALYTSGYAVDIQPEQDLRFFAKTGINSQFADDAENAVAQTRCYITITGQVARTLMTVDNCTGTVSPTGNQTLQAVWHHYYWIPSAGVPMPGVAYSVTLEFQTCYDPDDWSP
jgi:hypothetical protein